jgi:hypothetical protein
MSEKMIVDKLAINVNGSEKFATGLNKSTTIDDIKFAMLTASNPELLSHSHCELTAQLEDYGVFEKWQGNERILDGRIKIYKLIRLWQSLPGDQLSQVKFLIKQRKPVVAATAKITKLAYSERHQQQQSNQQTTTTTPSRKFDLCTLSPAMQKTWNYEKLKRKSSYVHRQLMSLSNNRQPRRQEEESSSEESSQDELSSDVEETGKENCHQQRAGKRYASIKRYNRSKKSTIKKTHQIKKSFIELVNKQNEIIDKQLSELSKDKSSTRRANEDEQVFEMFNEYLSVETCLNDKLKRIESLKSELNQLINSNVTVPVESSSSAFDLQNLNAKIKSSIVKTNKKLATSIELECQQNDKITNLSQALNKIDDVICLKTKFIQSLEDELKRLEELSVNDNNNQVESVKSAGKVRSLSMAKSSSTSSTASSASSSSSLFTSISSISSSSSNSFLKSSQMLNYSQQQATNQMTMIGNKSSSNQSSYVCNDNESDTGISSANSEDFNTQQLETLV